MAKSASVVSVPVRASAVVDHPAWAAIKDAAARLRAVQVHDGSVPVAADHAGAREAIGVIVDALVELADVLPHDEAYLRACAVDFSRWSQDVSAVPDFYDSLALFDPAGMRVDGLAHVVVFPMYTQNGSSDRFVEAVLLEVVWPRFIAELEAEAYSNALFVPVRFVDFTAGYDTNSAVLFPETVAMRAVPTFTWGAIFADREAARFRAVTQAAAEITKLDLPKRARKLLEDQDLAMETFVMWDLIHDRTHMRGDLPFDPFMIKQRMPYFLYSLEEMRCDLTAFREAVRIERELAGLKKRSAVQKVTLKRARLVQYAILFDRIFRFPLTGSRVRNYDGLGGQLLFAYLHQCHVIEWTDVKLRIDWERLPDAVVELGDQIDQLYWASIDRPKQVHWLAAYELVASVLPAHPGSVWAVRGFDMHGSGKAWTDAVLDEEFPLSMFYEALGKKLSPVIEATRGIRG